eukprot:9142675-Lingulodinium_polyedra.AAC.1
MLLVEGRTGGCIVVDGIRPAVHGSIPHAVRRLGRSGIGRREAGGERREARGVDVALSHDAVVTMESHGLGHRLDPRSNGSRHLEAGAARGLALQVATLSSSTAAASSRRSRPQ